MRGEPGSESSSELEKLLLEKGVQFKPMDIPGKDDDVSCSGTSTVICAGNTCVRTLIIVALE
jgi:hypothetical protein